MKELVPAAVIILVGIGLFASYTYVSSNEEVSKFNNGFWEAPFHTSDVEYTDPYLNTNTTPFGSNVNSFDDCVNAGFAVMESYPRQCRTDDGKHFVEDVAPIKIDNDNNPEIQYITGINGAPSELGLPYAIESLDLGHGASHPMGVYRFSEDKLAHPGIDLQLIDGASIFSMSDGEVILIEDGSSFPGDKLVRIQVRDTNWGINYEHFVPDEGLEVGQIVKKGDKLGTFKGGYTKIPASVHIDYRDYPTEVDGHSKDVICWINNLEEEDRVALQAAWDEAKITDEFISSWMNLQQDGKYIFRGLLDEEKYPDGPRMCYSGVDVRE